MFKLEFKNGDEEIIVTKIEYKMEKNCPFWDASYMQHNVITLYNKFTKKRASFVCEQALSYYAKELGIDKHIRVGHGQIGNVNDTIIADVFESVLGAIYLTHGLNVAKEYIYEIIVPYIEKDFVFFGDYKTMLQEYVQTDKKSLEYILVNEYGEAHNKTFEVEVKINNIIYILDI